MTIQHVSPDTVLPLTKDIFVEASRFIGTLKNVATTGTEDGTKITDVCVEINGKHFGHSPIFFLISNELPLPISTIPVEIRFADGIVVIRPWNHSDECPTKKSFILRGPLYSTASPKPIRNHHDHE